MSGDRTRTDEKRRILARRATFLATAAATIAAGCDPFAKPTVCLSVACVEPDGGIHALRVVPREAQPDPSRLCPGDKVELQVMLQGDCGEKQTRAADSQWRSSNESVARVGPDGVVVAVSRGEATIGATRDGLSGSLLVTVIECADAAVDARGASDSQ